MLPISIQKQKKVFSISGGEATESILNFVKAMLLNGVCRQGLSD